jgi:hypothetical protein
MLSRCLKSAIRTNNSFLYPTNRCHKNIVFSQFRSINDEAKKQNLGDSKVENIQEQLETKKHELKHFIDNKKIEIQDKLEDKKDELQSSILHSKNDLKEFIEDKKEDLLDKVQETSIEIKKQKKIKITRAILNFADRSIDYLKNYSNVLTQAFPNQLVKTYKIFSNGTKQLMLDVRTYARIKDTLVNSIDKNRSHSLLKRSDYEVFMNLPKDGLRVLPVLVISAFPFAQNVTLPLALLYPKVFLSSHFLTDQQQDEMIVDRARFQHQIYPLLKEELIRCTDMTYETVTDLANLRKTLQSGQSLSKDDILKLRPLFEIGGPLDIRHLTRRHDKLLASFHRVWYIMFPYKYLERYANMLWRMDQSLLR